MKRISLLLLVFSLFLTGCGIAYRPIEPVRAFSCTVTVHQENYSMTADLVSPGDGTLYWELKQPETVAGLKLTYENGVFHTEAWDVTEDIALQTLPDRAPIVRITEAILTLLFTDGTQIGKKDSVFSAAASLQGHPLTARFSKDGLLQSLSCPELQFDAVFQ